jgi:hypothetical protein
MKEEFKVDIANLRLTIVDTTCVDAEILFIYNAIDGCDYFYEILERDCIDRNINFGTVVVKLTSFNKSSYVTFQ